jgi:hypothetical protein
LAGDAIAGEIVAASDLMLLVMVVFGWSYILNPA